MSARIFTTGIGTVSAAEAGQSAQAALDAAKAAGGRAYDATAGVIESASDRIGRGIQGGLDQVNTFVRWGTVALIAVAVIALALSGAYITRTLFR